MNLLNYPPQIERKIQAFAYEAGDVIKINVPYVLNKAISLNAFDKMALLVKTATTSQPKWRGETAECKMYSNTSHSYYASFIIPKADFNPVVGNYYKLQLAFVNATTQSNWSTVGIAKCTSIPQLSINSLINEIDNTNPEVFIGVYENSDAAEKVYSYKFTIYDDAGIEFETSGELIHNGTNDEVIAGVGVRATMEWKPQQALKPYVRYRITLSTTSLNGYHKTTAPYVIKAVSTIDTDIPAKLLATPDYDNGCIHLSLINPNAYEKEKAFSGSFVISRYTKHLNTWDQIYKFTMLAQRPSDMGILWTDYTVEHGGQYLYALQAYNRKGLYSNRLLHVVANLNTSSANKYLETDEFGEPYYVTGDFEDMFLTDSTRQLKVRFNPQVSSYKQTILENKVETMGSKYPFIFRNGQVNYKEFPISGLLSYLTDEKELFMKGIRPIENDMKRRGTPAAAGAESREDWLDVPSAGSRLTSENFHRERQFKMEVLEWLNNGEPKLFRSAGEGNCIVRLMNVSLSPNDTLGRMLHTFNTTAYEIADYSFENLNKYGLIYMPETTHTVMKFIEQNIQDNSVYNIFSPGCNMYHVTITNAPPHTKYTLYFNELTDNSAVTYEIGLTGSLYLDHLVQPVTSIKTESGDEAHTAVIRYGYYDTAIPDNFNQIARIDILDEMSMIVDVNYTDNIIDTILTDIRRRVDRFYNITIKPKNLELVYKESGKLYNYYTRELINPLPVTIYCVVNKNAEPNATIITEYQYYEGGILKTHNELPSYMVKINDEVIDFSVGNTLTHIGFIEYTQGAYRISSDMGEIKALHISDGVYAELSYGIKELEYAVEEKDITIINAKKAWQESKDAWLALEKDPEADANERISAYNNITVKYQTYLTELETALENDI